MEKSNTSRMKTSSEMLTVGKAHESRVKPSAGLFRTEGVNPSGVFVTDRLDSPQSWFNTEQVQELTENTIVNPTSANNIAFIEESNHQHELIHSHETNEPTLLPGIDENNDISTFSNASGELGTPNMSGQVKLEDDFSCPLCPEVFADNEQWLHHHKSVHGSMCPSCQRIFKSWKSLRLHVMTAHKPQLTGFVCKFCGKRFTQQHHYRGHMKSHNGIKEFRCQHCNQEFTYRSGLTVHMRKCGGLVGDYKCSICQKDFLKQCHLREHISGMHSDTPRYTCKSCGEKFLWRDALSRHRAKTCHS